MAGEISCDDMQLIDSEKTRLSGCVCAFLPMYIN